MSENELCFSLVSIVEKRRRIHSGICWVEIRRGKVFRATGSCLRSQISFLSIAIVEEEIQTLYRGDKVHCSFPFAETIAKRQEDSEHGDGKILREDEKGGRGRDEGSSPSAREGGRSGASKLVADGHDLTAGVQSEFFCSFSGEKTSKAFLVVVRSV